MYKRSVESRLTTCLWRRGVRTSFVILLLVIGVAQATRSARGTGVETTENTVVTVSAASFELDLPVAPESIVAMFGPSLATAIEVAATIPLPKELAGTRVKFKDSLGVEREAGLLFVSPTQINCVIPQGTATGIADVTVVAGNGIMSTGTVEIAISAPGIFTASSDGKGVPAAIVLHYYPDTTFTSENAFQESQGGFIPRPIDLGPAPDSVFLILFGTGIRGAPNSVKVLIGGLELTPTYAGIQPEFEGLDQVNLLIDRSLIGKGQIDVSVVSFGSGDSNLVEVNIASPPGPQPPTVTGISGPSNLLVQDVITLNGTMFSANPEENTVRIGGIDATVELASTTQLKARVGFGTQTGPMTVSTSGGTWTSPTSLQVRTSMSGLVRDTNNQPIPGALVSLLLGSTPVPTSSEGSYVLPDTPGGSPPSGLLIGFKVVTGVTSPDGLPYTLTYPQKMPVVTQRDNQYGGAIYLQQANGPGYTIGGAGGSGFAGAMTSRASSVVDPMLTIGGVTLTLPAGLSALFPGGATSGTIVLDVLKDSLTPAPMPPAIFSSSVAQITPFGVQLTPGAKLTFPNLDGFPNNARLNLYKYDLTASSPTVGTFVDTGKAAFVTANGTLIETEANAITEASLYFVALARPLTTLTGRVVDSDGITPRRGAIVRARGRETRSDGNGGFVLQRVSAIAGLPIPVTANFLRANGRVDLAFKLSAPAEIKGLTRAGNLVLSSATSNRAPLIYVKTYLEVYAGHALAILAGVMDLDEALTDVSFSGPGFAQFTSTGVSGAYLLRVAPSTGQEGTYVMAITATDSGGLTTRREITLVVKPRPVANAQSVQTNEDQAVQISLGGSDAESRPLTFKVKTAPQHGILTGIGPATTYTPAQNFSGQDSFTFVVDNGLVESIPATVSITVVPVNDPPVIVVPGAQTVNTGSLLTFGVGASDPDPSQTLTLTASNLPTGALFTQNPMTNTGTFSWTPTGAQVGVHSVNFTATDNGVPSLNDSKAVTITVASPGIWRPTAGPDGGTITAFLSGTAILAGTEGNGIFRSTDNGANWLGANSGLGNPFVTSFATLGGAVFVGTEGGVYRSLDGGQTWTALNNGLTNGNVRALTVAVGTLYAGTEGGGVFMFIAEISGWIATNAGITNLSVRALTSIGEVVYAANAVGVFILLPGQPWSPFSTGLPAARVVSFALRSTTGGPAIIAGTQGSGVYQRLAGGGNWSSLNLGLGNLVVNVVGVSVGDVFLFAGTQGGGLFRFEVGAPAPAWVAINNGLTNPIVRSMLGTALTRFVGTNGGGIFRSQDNGNNWTPANNGIPRALVTYLVSNGGTLFAATNGGGVHASSNNGGSWTGVNNGLQNLVVSSLAVSGGNLLAGTLGSGVYRSMNGGASWSAANSGLGNPLIQSLALNGNTGFAGTDAGSIWVTTNAGTSWAPASNGLGGSAVYAIFANGGFIFAGTNGDGIYRSSNNGGNWSPANNGLGSLRVSSFAANATAIFAGTLEGGVYRSTDNGASWNAVNNGITASNIYSLLVSGNNIYASSKGGGVFVSSNGGNSWSAINQGLTFPFFVVTLAGNGSAIFAGTDGDGVFILE